MVKNPNNRLTCLVGLVGEYWSATVNEQTERTDWTTEQTEPVTERQDESNYLNEPWTADELQLTDWLKWTTWINKLNESKRTNRICNQTNWPQIREIEQKMNEKEVRKCEI